MIIYKNEIAIDAEKVLLDGIEELPIDLQERIRAFLKSIRDSRKSL